MHKNAYVLPLAALAVSLTAQGVAPAAVSFEDPVSYAVGGGPRHIATADINQAACRIEKFYRIDLWNIGMRENFTDDDRFDVRCIGASRITS